MEENSTQSIDHDGNWKLMIENLADDFFAFFLPEIYPLIDKNFKPEFLDKEFHKIIGKATNSGKTIKDKLVKVRLINGEDCWLVIHIEIQSTFETDFAKRMHRYFYRLLDKNYENIAAMAIYTGNEIPKNYKKFEFNQPYAKATYEFGTYKVRDAREEELLQSSNPFALAVLACKYINKSKGNNNLRFEFKRKMFKLAIERGYSQEKIGFLLNFIEYMLLLPKELDEKLRTEIFKTYLMDNTRPLRKDTFLLDFFHRLNFGIPFKDALLKAEEEARLKAEEEIRLKAEEEIRLKVEEARLKAEEKEQENTRQSIKNLLLLGLKPEQISSSLNISIDLVNNIHRQMDTNN